MLKIRCGADKKDLQKICAGDFRGVLRKLKEMQKKVQVELRLSDREPVHILQDGIRGTRGSGCDGI